MDHPVCEIYGICTVCNSEIRKSDDRTLTTDRIRDRYDVKSNWVFREHCSLSLRLFNHLVESRNPVICDVIPVTHLLHK